jgi:quercetin dioxygenase-like cupin family protein
MNAADFERQLTADGYQEIETKQYAPRPQNGEHGHHFSVRGLVLEGSFIVTQGGRTVAYSPGEVFVVPEGGLHCEEIGPEGARVLVGRKF